MIDNRTAEAGSPRRRISVSTTSKGLFSWDCTVEHMGGTLEDAIAESDALVAELRRRYPAPLEG